MTGMRKEETKMTTIEPAKLDELDRLFERPDWDHYFLQIARAVALRASCRRKKVGAVLADGDHRIVGSGYNGAPRGLPDCFQADCDVRVIDGRESCVRTLHAESNAIDFAHLGADSVTLYSTVIPCRLCALRIIQVGIVRVVFEEYYESQGTKEVAALFRRVGIELKHYVMP